MSDLAAKLRGGRGDTLNSIMMKSLGDSTKDNSESGSSNGGNNSDNSALVSLGNNSFGFNFDSEEGMSNDSKEGQNDSDDGDGNQEKVPEVALSSKKRRGSKRGSRPKPSSMDGNSNSSAKNLNSKISSLTSNSDGQNPEQNEAAENAVASLESIARTYTQGPQGAWVSSADNDRKRKALLKSSEDDSKLLSEQEGDDDGSKRSRRNKKPLDNQKREERNHREKERSFRISKQITELRNLLATGGVMVPKGTKSSVLTEAANYIRMLQQHQYKSEIDRHQLIQQMQQIGGGANGPQAAAAIRHFAAQNGVWSLGNFGGVPPKSAMSFDQSKNTPAATISEPEAAPSQDSNLFSQSKIEPSEYRFIFNSCGTGMAIASMGGAFIDCNQLFCQLSNYSKQEVCSLTIFNLTARPELQRAFDKISQLISPPLGETITEEQVTKPVVIRGAMKNRDDLGMSVSLVKGEDGIAKCFCVTLVKNPASPFDTAEPVPVSFDAIQRPMQASTGVSKESDAINMAPTFTSG